MRDYEGFWLFWRWAFGLVGASRGFSMEEVVYFGAWLFGFV